MILPDGGKITYTYDAYGNKTSKRAANGNYTTYTYDENNKVTSVTKPDGSRTETVYDDAQRVVSTVERAADGTVITGFEYTYDSLSRIVEEKALANNTKMCYNYDKNSRVVEKYEYDKYDTEDEWAREYYTYDKAGNITELFSNCGWWGYQNDTNNRLLKRDSYANTFDADGNMISAKMSYTKTLSFNYDSANRLISAGENTYTYNAEDVRIRNLCGSDDTKYVYDTNARLSRLLVRRKNGVVTKYIYGRGLIGEECAGVYKTYHFDYRGSTVAITDICGNITDTFKYDTYGGLDSRTGTTDTPFMYNGRDGVVTDANGLLYMRARYYSPILMRFVNADIVAGDISEAISLNRYAYANGNPVSNVDPFGLSAERSAVAEDESWYTEDISNILHTVLDFTGFIPGAGEIADGLNALLYAVEGDWLNAGMSAISAIPVIGELAGGAKWLGKLFKHSDDVVDAMGAIAKVSSKADDVGDVARTASKGISPETLAERVQKLSSAYSDLDASNLTKMSHDELAKWATTGTPNQIGRKGEFLAGIDPSKKQSINISGRTRIPDELIDNNIREVKNVKKYLTQHN